MKVLGIIPARYQSTRFPGKPLALIHGISMIQRVYKRAARAETLDEVVVATDDQRIYDHVVDFGGKVLMTSATHPSGTDRCAEALKLSEGHYDVVINIQGDEPFIHPQQIDLLVKCFNNKEASIATLVKHISHPDELNNRNIPKVVRDHSGLALYFSRQPIPWCDPQMVAEMLDQGRFLKHIGIYGYRAAILPVLAGLPAGNLEMSESLEQLRWLEHGYKIMTAVSDHENMAVDTPGDVELIEKRFNVLD